MLKICPDVKQWPKSWEGIPEDVKAGEAILKILLPFMEWLTDYGYSKNTVKRHFDNLWALGGELIQELHWNDRLRKNSAYDLILDAINEEGGPLLSNAISDNDQQSFDATCRKLYKYFKG